MPDSILDMAPPEGFEQYGWTCVYHRSFCHNPSDCDFAPLFLPVAGNRQGWRRWADLTEDERDEMYARKR